MMSVDGAQRKIVFRLLQSKRIDSMPFIYGKVDSVLPMKPTVSLTYESN